MFVFVRSLRWGQETDREDATRTRIGRAAALAAGLAFAFSDPFWVHFGNLNYIAVASWLPWVMAVSCERSIHSPLPGIRDPMA